jgi:hypothetical protein
MNSPKEKAQELVDKYKMVHEDERGSLWNEISIHTLSKQSALIAVDEILDDDVFDMSEELFEARIQYWENVKKEIGKL